jgi:hypothetical protein
MRSHRSVEVAAGIVIKLDVATRRDSVTVWLWTNRYKVDGTKHLSEYICKALYHAAPTPKIIYSIILRHLLGHLTRSRVEPCRQQS